MRKIGDPEVYGLRFLSLEGALKSLFETMFSTLLCETVTESFEESKYYLRLGSSGQGSYGASGT